MDKLTDQPQSAVSMDKEPAVVEGEFTEVDSQMQSPDPKITDWLTAELEYLAQRPIDGSIPLKQLWGVDTIERRAYQIYLARLHGQTNPLH